MTYNPVTKKGTFTANGEKVNAVDMAEARYHLAKKLGIAYGTVEYFKLAIVNTVPTVRLYN